MIEEYKGTVSTPTKTDYIISMGTHQNCLDEAVQSIRRYAHMIEEYKDTVSTSNIAVCIITLVLTRTVLVKRFY